MVRQRCAAFTIVELAVCLLVIVFLMMLILPAVAMAKGAARQLHCSSNLGKIAAASSAFSEDCRGYVPLNYMHVKGRMQTWEEMVEPYVERVWVKGVSEDGEMREELLSDPFRCPISMGLHEGERLSDYSQNSFEMSKSYLTPGEMDLRRPVYIPVDPEMEYLPSFGWYRMPLRMAEIAKPSEVYCRGDATVRDWNVSDEGSVVGRHSGRQPGDKDGVLNVQFWDGHVALYEKGSLMWDEPRGKNWLPYEGY